MSELSDWINEEIQKRGWKQAELAQRAKISTGTLSMVLNEGRGAGPKFCKSIARAFGIPPVEVFRRAGLLPPIRDDAILRELIEVAETLTKEERIMMLNMALGLQAKRHLSNAPSDADAE
jgi:transcriptional regulator with XRE-family HTH domain